MLPFATEYPPELDVGYWGLGTSTIDWCEENYVVSPYIAEALNTVTNSWFIILALYATYSAYKNQHEYRFLLIGFGFSLVGVGSWLFHMTLLYKYQLLDELPMIYATCVPFWSVFSEFKDLKKSIFIGVGVFSAANLLTFVYLYLKNPTIHQVGYAVLNIFIIAKSAVLTNKYVLDASAKRQLYKTMASGVFIFLFGYFLWNLDIHLCQILRSTRRSWGMPYGFILEGHGWWHIFTGTGVYFYLVYLEYLRLFLIGKETNYDFVWRLGMFPEIVLNAKGKANGNASSIESKKEE